MIPPSPNANALGRNIPTLQLLAVSDAGSNTLGFKDGVTGTTEYHYDYNGNMTADQNKGISSITYNHLNLPETVDMGGGNTITYTYDAAGAKLKQEIKEGGTLKTTRSYVGGFIYEQEGTGDKELSLIQTEEGRLVPWRVNENIAGYEYQYHLTDHLGNVRLTFAGNNEAEVTATMETETSSFEEDIFRNMGTRQLVVTGLNHTPVDPLITVPDHAAYLEMAGGATTEIVGPATSFAVNMADTVDIEVFGKFEDQASFSTTVLGGIAGELANAFVNLTGLENLSEATDAFSNAFTAIGQYGGNDSSTPRAFLNYILFDEDHDYVTSGFDRMDDGAGVTPPNESAVAFDKMAFSIPVTKKGYIYIYVSNETPGAKVWFDDLTVTHIENEVVQADDYYPFGLTMASTSYMGEDRLRNDYLFNAESEFETNANWYNTPFRKFDGALGSFTGIDFFADFLPGINPYQFGFNSPVSFNDPLGLIPGCPQCTGIVLDGVTITATRLLPLSLERAIITFAGASIGGRNADLFTQQQLAVSQINSFSPKAVQPGGFIFHTSSLNNQPGLITHETATHLEGGIEDIDLLSGGGNGKGGILGLLKAMKGTLSGMSRIEALKNMFSGFSFGESEPVLTPTPPTVPRTVIDIDTLSDPRTLEINMHGVPSVKADLIFEFSDGTDSIAEKVKVNFGFPKRK